MGCLIGAGLQIGCSAAWGKIVIWLGWLQADEGGTGSHGLRGVTVSTPDAVVAASPALAFVFPAIILWYGPVPIKPSGRAGRRQQ
jgi:hypothetical protein